MKDSEFVELLNLYIDHEISAADAARLEAEVQTHPARRRVYRQYCRLHRACKLAAADFHTEAPTSTAAAAMANGDRNVVAFDPEAVGADGSATGGRRKRAGIGYTAGTFAALAACIAIVFVGHNRRQEQQRLDGSAESSRSQQVAARTPAMAAAAVVAPEVSAVSQPQPQLVAVAGAGASETPGPRGLVSVAPRPQAHHVRALFLTGHTQAQAVLAAAERQADSQLAWLETVQLAPLQTRTSANDDLHFAATLGTEGRALGNRTSLPTKQKESEPAEEMVTFQFMK